MFVIMIMPQIMTVLFCIMKVSFFVMRHIQKCKMWRLVMGLVCIRPNGGAEKMEPFTWVLEAHYTHLNSSVE